MKKMNNKGFSLVELIVVVLIMAIIAVALAPQVMKWVENSRKSNDIENYNALVEAANVAGTNEDVLKNLTSAVTIEFYPAGTKVPNQKLLDAMKKTIPELENATTGAYCDKIKVTGDWSSTYGNYNNGEFQIKVEKTADGIKVTKPANRFPDKNFS
ncbi:MAG: type II secretion system GspH family protein [Lachnospiraceae bacterium]|nr:type II secretion system GspH family protein [Lachnospiraceae bacterium]